MTLVLAGCNESSSQRLIGKWKFDAAKAATEMAKKENNEMAATAIGLLQASGQKMEMIFEFGPDQKGNVSAAGIPAFNYDGPFTWKTVESKGDKLTIEITNPKVNQSSRVQITFIDNDHLTFSPPEANAKSMEFERVKEK
jgi:hypothetical protein